MRRAGKGGSVTAAERPTPGDSQKGVPHSQVELPIMHKLWFRVLIATAILAACFFYVYTNRMIGTGDWCLRTEEQVAKQCDLLTKVANLLQAHNFQSWVCYGTALAAYRNGKPIPWEIDDDLCVLQKDLANIRFILEESAKDLNIEVIYADDFNVVAMQVRLKHVNGVLPAGDYTIDFYAHKEHTFFSSIRMMQNVALIRDRMKRDMPTSMLYPLQPMPYCAHPDRIRDGAEQPPLFRGPGNITEYLTHLYGTTFRTPNTIVDSNGWRGWRCYFWKA
jgi:hypothetical protein